MERVKEGLSLLQLSAVQELANIGLGRAATALSDLTGACFNMGIPHVSETELEALPGQLKKHFGVYAAVYTPVTGDFEGHMAFLFDWESVQSLCGLLCGSIPATEAAFDELHASVVMEVGNILNSSFLNALGEMTGLTIHISPPLGSLSDAESILSSIVVEAEMMDSMALSVDTALESLGNTHLVGSFLLIPGHDGLSSIFMALGLGDAA